MLVSLLREECETHDVRLMVAADDGELRVTAAKRDDTRDAGVLPVVRSKTEWVKARALLSLFIHVIITFGRHHQYKPRVIRSLGRSHRRHLPRLLRLRLALSMSSPPPLLVALFLPLLSVFFLPLPCPVILPSSLMPLPSLNLPLNLPRILPRIPPLLRHLSLQTLLPHDMKYVCYNSNFFIIVCSS